MKFSAFVQRSLIYMMYVKTENHIFVINAGFLMAWHIYPVTIYGLTKKKCDMGNHLKKYEGSGNKRSFGSHRKNPKTK